MRGEWILPCGRGVYLADKVLGARRLRASGSPGFFGLLCFDVYCTNIIRKELNVVGLELESIWSCPVPDSSKVGIEYGRPLRASWCPSREVYPKQKQNSRASKSFRTRKSCYRMERLPCQLGAVVDLKGPSVEFAWAFHRVLSSEGEKMALLPCYLDRFAEVCIHDSCI